METQNIFENWDKVPVEVKKEIARKRSVAIAKYQGSINKGKAMTTLQLNQEVLRQVGSISNNDSLLKKVIDFIKSITPIKENRTLGKKEQLENILSMSNPCDLSEEEIASEIDKGRQEFYDNRKRN